MKKITKKLFNEFHKNKLIELIQNCSNKTPDQLIPLIENYKGKLPSIPVSRIDTSDQGNYLTVKIYSKEINNNVYYLFHEIIDNSKNNQCSWNTIENNTILYVLI